MQPFLIDTHAHIYLPEFKTDTAFIKKAEEAGVKIICLPAIDSKTHEDMLRTEAENFCCKSMMGLHPCSVNETLTEELQLIKAYYEQRKFIAVGEIGLDFYWDRTFEARQYQAFHQQIEVALQYSLPVVIHSRNATDECIQVVEQYPELRGVFHCFSGTMQQAQKLISLEFMLGIGGVVTFKNSGLDKVVQAIGLSNLVLETDAPYLAPVPFRGKQNQPAYLSLIAEKVASILEVDIIEVAEATTFNAKKLFGLQENY